jgi:hypothetical protein
VPVLECSRQLVCASCAREYCVLRSTLQASPLLSSSCVRGDLRSVGLGTREATGAPSCSLLLLSHAHTLVRNATQPARPWKLSPLSTPNLNTNCPAAFFLFSLCTSTLLTSARRPRHPSQAVTPVGIRNICNAPATIGRTPQTNLELASSPARRCSSQFAFWHANTVCCPQRAPIPIIRSVSTRKRA